MTACKRSHRAFLRLTLALSLLPCLSSRSGLPQAHTQETPDPALALRELLTANATAQSPGRGVLGFQMRHRDASGQPPAECQVLLEQPLMQPFVLVLVYDTQAAGRKKVFIRAAEGYHTDAEDDDGSPSSFRYEKPRPISIPEAYPDSGVFLGRVWVKGSHGTSITVRYIAAGYDCDKTAVGGMVFH